MGRLTDQGLHVEAFRNPAIRESYGMPDPVTRIRVSEDLHNVTALVGDLRGLTGGDCTLLSGIVTPRITGPVPKGKAGCVTDYEGPIADMENGRRCTRKKCPRCTHQTFQ